MNTSIGHNGPFGKKYKKTKENIIVAAAGP